MLYAEFLVTDNIKDVIEVKTIDSLTFYLNKFKNYRLSNIL